MGQSRRLMGAHVMSRRLRWPSRLATGVMAAAAVAFMGLPGR